MLKKLLLRLVIYFVIFTVIFNVLNIENGFWTIFLASLIASFLIVLVEKCISKFEEK